MIDEPGGLDGPGGTDGPYGYSYTIHFVDTSAAASSSVKTFFGSSEISKMLFGSSTISALYFGNTKIYEGSSAPVVDPVLNNNSWAVIKQVCESGQASNYWAVGDTKSDLGTDGNTRTFRIADMSGLYNKHVVFEQVNIVGSTQKWASYGNNWSTSYMRDTVLPAELLKLSSDLQAIITDTTIQTATNGKNGTLISTTDKLFLPAEKEVSASRTDSVPQEFNTLVTWGYYSIHTSNADRAKDYENYWLRSPVYNKDNLATLIRYDGLITGTYSYADYSAYVTPCFSL